MVSESNRVTDCSCEQKSGRKKGPKQLVPFYHWPAYCGPKVPKNYRLKAWSTVRRNWLRSRPWITIDFRVENESRLTPEILPNSCPSLNQSNVRVRSTNNNSLIRKGKKKPKFKLGMLIMMIPSFAVMFYIQTKLYGTSNLGSSEAVELLTTKNFYRHHRNDFSSIGGSSGAREAFRHYDDENDEATDYMPSLVNQGNIMEEIFGESNKCVNLSETKASKEKNDDDEDRGEDDY